MFERECKCTICRYIVKKYYSDVQLETVFDEKSRAISVYLCRVHSVELFKKGQVKFLSKYAFITRMFIGFPEQKFFSLMGRVASSRKHNYR